MKPIQLIVSFLLVVSVSQPSWAAPYIAVGKANTKKSVVAIAPFVWSGNEADRQNLSKSMKSQLEDALNFMGVFKLLPSSAFIETPGKAGVAPGSFKMTDWSGIGTEFLVKTQASLDNGKLTVEGHLYEVTGGKEILGRRYSAEPTDSKKLALTFANNIVEALTELPGIFLTKIVMSCDRTGKKEIYVMDYNGQNVKQITSHRSIAFAPAWSPDGSKLVYSLYTRHRDNVKNIDLYEYNFRTSTVKLLSNRQGINSGATYHPDGKRMALTMSFLKNPEIFMLDPDNASVTRVTNSLGFDVDPTFNPDGSQLAFVSSRSGKPMVYAMNVDGSNIRRLTYAGRYNASPSWSPQNNKIAFAGWLDGVFDIFVMNPDGTNIERLTKKQGNNEDPHFSPDGNFVVFSSNRAGSKNIYVMNVDGGTATRLTYGMGNCVAPKWSAVPK